MWRRSGLFLARLVFSLWLTASLVFTLSRFLPSLYTPKGLHETDVAIFANSSAKTLASIKEEYLRSQGLLNPTFYFSLHLKGSSLAKNLKVLELDLDWVEKSVQWHGDSQTRLFYSNFQTWQKTQSGSSIKLLRGYLLKWAKSKSPIERATKSNQITLLFEKTELKLPKNDIVRNWQNLNSSLSPPSYYLPSFTWNGTNNQYHLWLMNLLTGNLGFSLRDYTPVSQKISQAFFYSAWIGFGGLLVATTISYFLGKSIAIHAGRKWSKGVRHFLYLLDSVPGFLLALLLLYIFLKAGGALSYQFTDGDFGYFSDSIHLLQQTSFLLSICCLSLLLIPYLSLQFYHSLFSERSALYMRTARSKGLTWPQAILQHALLNVLGPIITLLSEIIIGLLAGVLLIEITFNLPGLGTLLTQSILTADYPVLIGITLFLLLFRVIIVQLSEIILSKVDPRISAT